MPKADTWETGLLNLLFTNAAFGGVGDTNGLQPSAGTGSLYLSLHTASPGDTGNQTTNESGYTGYARTAVARTGAAWTVGETGGIASSTNAAQVTFPLCTAGTSTITHVGVGTATSTNITAASNGQSLPQATINVTSTTGFPASGTILVFTGVAGSGGSYQTVTYTGTAGGNQFTGCSGGTGAMSTGGSVTQTGKLLYYGALASSLAVSNNITPSFAAGALVVTED